MKNFSHYLPIHFGNIFAVIAVGLLVLAANLNSPSVWLLVAAWGLLGLRVWLWFEDNKENEQKSAPFVLLVIPLFVVAAASQRFQISAVKVLESPTLENLEALTWSSPFLFLVACYFALSLHFTKMKLRKVEDDYENLNKRRLEEIALYQSELKILGEKILAGLNKTGNN